MLTQADMALAGICRAELPGKIEVIAQNQALTRANVGILIEATNTDTAALCLSRSGKVRPRF